MQQLCFRLAKAAGTFLLLAARVLFFFLSEFGRAMSSD
jgi:hypothetical protein